MAPPKSTSKAAHDDGKAETANHAKEKNGHGSNNHSTNGKLRRVASSTGTNSKDAASANAAPAATGAAPEPIVPTVSTESIKYSLQLIADCGSLPSSNGPPSTATCSMPTDANITSRRRPRTRHHTIKSSSLNREVLAYIRQRWRGERNTEDRRRSNWPRQSGSTSMASASRRTTWWSSSSTRFGMRHRRGRACNDRTRPDETNSRMYSGWKLGLKIISVDMLPRLGGSIYVAGFVPSGGSEYTVARAPRGIIIAFPRFLGRLIYTISENRDAQKCDMTSFFCFLASIGHSWAFIPRGIFHSPCRFRRAVGRPDAFRALPTASLPQAATAKKFIDVMTARLTGASSD